jgi:hypothetical protein
MKHTFTILGLLVTVAVAGQKAKTAKPTKETKPAAECPVEHRVEGCRRHTGSV